MQIRGDWAVRRPDIPTGGFPFEFENDNYPDVDDTAVVVLALRRAANGDPTCRGAADRGLAWALGMQSEDGGWGAFDVDNTSELPLKLPFCDFGAVTDPPSADVTAHMVELLGYEGLASDAAHAPRARLPAARAGARRLVVRPLGREPPLRHRRGRAGARGLRDAPSTRACARRVDWLDRVQNADGGFGEDLRSYRDAALARPRRVDRVADRVGAARLPRRRRRRARRSIAPCAGWSRRSGRGGGWDEPYYTGTGFPATST